MQRVGTDLDPLLHEVAMLDSVVERKGHGQSPILHASADIKDGKPRNIQSRVGGLLEWGPAHAVEERALSLKGVEETGIVERDLDPGSGVLNKGCKERQPLLRNPTADILYLL